MQWRVGLILAAVLVVYLLLGGVIFHFLEAEPEQETTFMVTNFTRDFLADHPCIDHEDVDKLVQTVLEAYDRGVRTRNGSATATNWDYASAVFFSLTVVTTIGYGHISPVTPGGRALCVLYAIIGIPLTLYFLTGLGSGLNEVNKRWDRAMGGCRNNPKAGRALRMTLIFLTGFIVLLIVPGVIFMYVDDWTFAEAMYCVFITLTTIGFGDYVPGSLHRQSRADGATLVGSPGLRSFYRLFTVVIIFCGLAWISSIIAHMQEWYAKVGEKTSQELNKRKYSDGNDNCAMDTSIDKSSLDNSFEKPTKDIMKSVP